MHAGDGKEVAWYAGDNKRNQGPHHIDKIVKIKESFAAEDKGDKHQNHCRIA